MFAYCLNNPVNMADYDGGLPAWTIVLIGVGVAVGVGVLTAATMGAAAPGAICMLTYALTSVGVSAEIATGVATVGAMTVTAAATIYAADEAYASVTGESPVLEYVYRGNVQAYQNERELIALLSMGMLHASEYGTMCGVCFVEGTLISTEDGQIPIEEIKPGDLVWAWNEETGEVALKPVVETYINECDELIRLSVNGEIITCTPNHPFYVPQKGWTEAVHLRAGDILVLLNGEYVVLEKIQHELLEAPVTVYNFQVEGYHTYYVGESGIRVHNATCGGLREGKQSIPSGSQLIRSQRRKVNSSEFIDFIRSKGEPFRTSDWKYVMETWLTPWGESIERHYWYNKVTGEAYYHL